MRIAQVTATFPPQYTGTGMVCYYNALGLARLGHQVTVFTANHPLGEYSYPAEISVRRLPPLLQLGNAPILPQLLRLRDFDIIHLHHPFIFGAELIWAVSTIRRIPYVITHHNDLIGTGMRRHLFNAYSALLTPVVFKGARKLATVSKDHAAAGRLSSLFLKRWDDTIEIPNGVDTTLFNSNLDGSLVRRQLGIENDAVVSLFVGVLDRAHHYRRVDLLIQAVAALQDPTLHLIVAGGGDLLNHYKDMARNLNIAPKVHFTGELAHRDLPSVYAAADIVTLPSHLQEAFPLVLLEAMACGKPVIASQLPGVRSMVKDGENGLLAEPGDKTDLAKKIAVLVRNPTLRKEMGTQGRIIVETHYSWTALVAQIIQIYEEIVSVQ